MANPIPAAARQAVKSRDFDSCFSCGAPAAKTGQWHHRRSRSVRDPHCHCPCNGVWLCATCHKWVHANPFEARRRGLIVSRYVTEPATQPAHSGRRGWLTLRCDAHVVQAKVEQDEREHTGSP